MKNGESRSALTRFAWLSIAAALVTIALKTAAWKLTGSVGLLSDALESIVNLVAAVVALIALTVAAQPADEGHEHGHDKAEFFSSATEGVLIVVAAIGILFTGVRRLIWPVPLERLGIGLVISAVAALVNLAVALVLLRAGKKHQSITLEADAHHLLTDVATSIGVIAGVGLVAVTGIEKLDPIVAILVGIWIIRNGVVLVSRSITGLLDPAIDAAARERVVAILDGYPEIRWHALRTRLSGPLSFVTVHILVPGEWTVQRGHDLVERIEMDIRHELGTCTVMTHLEP
ncbi:MAG: cation diffusion facilitator family transporter, partial [Polyangiales bacterium]